MGVPCNQFGSQEPGKSEEIQSFCRLNYDVTFPMMAKVKVRGKNKVPLFKTLTEETSKEIRGSIKWNFTKFLVDTEGQVVRRFGSRTSPLSEKVVDAIESLLPPI